MITNNEDFYQYMTNRGVPCTYLKEAIDSDDLAVIFTNKCHALSTCGNRFQNDQAFEKEASGLLDWFERCNKVIMISNVIKLGTPYMAKHFEALQQRYDKLNIKKQVFNTKEIGSLILPHRVQIRYKNVRPIDFDFEGPNDNIKDPQHEWWCDDGWRLQKKRQQVHYLNVINATNDTETRRKLRYLPEYAIFSQLYKKLYL